MNLPIASRAKSVPASRKERGLTLVELMVSMTIGLFIVAIVGSIYISFKRNFWSTNAITAMDDTARAVFDLMGTSIRQAGFNGCQRMDDTINGDTRRLGSPVPWWENVNIPVQAKVIPKTGTDTDFPDAKDGTEVLMLISADSTNEASVVSDDPASATITTSVHTFQVTQALLATSCQINSFFIMTGGTQGTKSTSSTPGTPGTIQHTATATAPGNCDTSLGFTCGSTAPPVAATLPAGASILPLVATAWYVAPSGDKGSNETNKGHSLWQWSAASPNNPIEQVNGVENLAFEFGVDSDGDGSIDQWLATTTGIGSDQWANVLAIRVHLLVSTLPDSGAAAVGDNSKVPFNGGDLSAPAIDPRRVYREYSAVFTLRNRMN